MRWLEDLYPGSTDGGWRPLEPDKLGEYLVMREIRKSQEFMLSGALGASAAQHRRMFTVLGRAALQEENVNDLVSGLFWAANPSGSENPAAVERGKKVAINAIDLTELERFRLARSVLGLELRNYNRGLASELPLMRLAQELGYAGLDGLLLAVFNRQIAPSFVIQRLVAMVDRQE
jgi:hypothetical protein